jgi:hypothetical protein
MSVPDFYGPNLKIERAKHHINSLEAFFKQYISHNIKRLHPKRNNQFLERKRARTHALPTVLGDILHNLRAALDNAYCIMVEENGGTVTRWTLFPFHKERQSLPFLGASGADDALCSAPHHLNIAPA